MSKSENSAVDIKKILKKTEALNKKDITQILRNAIITNGIEAVAYNNKSQIALQNTFSNEIKSGKITSQEKSGRCWMFAGLNLFRNKIIKKLNVDDFEFSQNYTMFFDKLEKANYFLESIISTLNEDIYSRLLMWLLKDPLQDGGQWDMFVNLINKYGAVPKNIMPETYHSNNSALMNQLLTSLLRKWASDLRDFHSQGKNLQELRRIKSEYITDFYFVLTYFLGVPPEKFHYEYIDKKGKFHSLEQTSPQQFFKEYVNIPLGDYVSLIHAPTPDKPFNKTYTVEYLGNVIDGNIVLYLNIDLDLLKSCTIKQLKDGEPVWFGCDIRWQTERKKGLMDANMFLFDKAIGTKSQLDKSGRLLYGESMLSHAMVFTGVNLSNNKPTRWKVENSWGEDRGEKGFFIMSDSWFDEYNYQVVIHKKYLREEMREQLSRKPVLLPPWDPMGSLAF